MDLTELSRFVASDGRCANPKLINALAVFCGMDVARDADISEARQIAALTISHNVVAPEMFQAVQRITGASVFVVREEGRVTGFTACFGVRDEGVRAIEEGRFDSVNINLDWVARPYETPSAGYGWGFAGVTERATRTVVKTTAVLHEALFWGLPAYTRTATSDGERVILGGLGYAPVQGDENHLARCPPSTVPFARLRQRVVA